MKGAREASSSSRSIRPNCSRNTKEIVFPLLPFQSRIRNAAVNQILVHQVEETTRQLGITIVQDAPNAMNLTLKSFDRRGRDLADVIRGIEGHWPGWQSCYRVGAIQSTGCFPFAEQAGANGEADEGGSEKFLQKFIDDVLGARRGEERKARDKDKV